VALLYAMATALFVQVHADLRVSHGVLVYILLIVAAAAGSNAHADSLGLVLRPNASLVTTGQTVDVKLAVRYQTPGPFVAPQAQSFLALDVVLGWDPTKLQFLGLSTTGSIPMLFSYLPSPAQDYTGLNEANPPRDGDLIAPSRTSPRGTRRASRSACG